jgi:hypothetical protein
MARGRKTDLSLQRVSGGVKSCYTPTAIEDLRDLDFLHRKSRTVSDRRAVHYSPVSANLKAEPLRFVLTGIISDRMLNTMPRKRHCAGEGSIQIGSARPRRHSGMNIIEGLHSGS